MVLILKWELVISNTLVKSLVLIILRLEHGILRETRYHLYEFG